MPNMPRYTRVLAVVSFFLLVYVLVSSLRSPTVTGPKVINGDSKDWHDPNLDMIDEPPGPLRRVEGNNYAPDNANSARINATLLSLVRNEELTGIIQSMRDLERTFNSKFNYPWTFFNDVPFTQIFKDAVRKETNAEVSFHLIPAEHWDTPPWINQELYDESTRILKENGIQYADKLSYHQMCRWNSGLFAIHPALATTRYYWRVEPHVHFFCDISYDVFRYMSERNKTYGFTINLYDSPQSIPTLWPETQRFLAAGDNAARFLHPNNALGWLTDAAHRPTHTANANGYSTCHFWSNFEIAALDFWRADAYAAYFAHLDRAGGFFYERWGDAPVHSVGVALFADKADVHWFRDIGYQHVPFFNCPRRPPGKCAGCRTGMFSDGERWLYREDCRPSWLEHVGFGEWGDAEKWRAGGDDEPVVA